MLFCAIDRGVVLGFYAPVSSNVWGCRSGRASEKESVILQSVSQSVTAVLVGATKERSLQPSCSVLCGPGVVGWARRTRAWGLSLASNRYLKIDTH